MTRKQNRKASAYQRRRNHTLRNAILGMLLLLFGTGGTDYYLHGNVDWTMTFLYGILGREEAVTQSKGYISLDEIPKYDGNPYVVIQNNIPEFSESEYAYRSFEFYSELDILGRCGMAEAMLSRELMPTEPRGEIGMIRPSGWKTAKYDIIQDRYLFNRCHLIAFELTGENDNARNLITGTRYMNVSGMLPWENQVAQYIRRTSDKVLYRVTPVFQGNELVARGVHMEAKSIGSQEIQFNIFVFNVQPGIKIDYRDGNSWKE